MAMENDKHPSQSIAQTVLVGSVPSRPEAAKEFLPNFKDYFQVIF